MSRKREGSPQHKKGQPLTSNGSTYDFFTL